MFPIPAHRSQQSFWTPTLGIILRQQSQKIAGHSVKIWEGSLSFGLPAFKGHGAMHKEDLQKEDTRKLLCWDIYDATEMSQVHCLRVVKTVRFYGLVLHLTFGRSSEWCRRWATFHTSHFWRYETAGQVISCFQGS